VWGAAPGLQVRGRRPQEVLWLARRVAYDDDLMVRGGPRTGTMFFIALFVSAIVSAGVFLGARYLLPPKPKTIAIVDVPTVMGMQPVQARELLDGKGLLLVLDAQREDASAPGTIIAQTPLEGSRSRRYGEVHVVVSKGQQKVKVPDLAGQDATKATQALVEHKLVAGATEQEVSPTVAAGLVLATTPPAGTEVAPGAEVKLKVSAGAGTVAVPKVTGMTLKKAKELLAAAKFQVVAKSTYDEDRGAYVVLRQDPAEGAKVAPGATINLVYNEGDE
jgi:eukaryotic-like serine/threonine-protein kinase